MKKGDPGYWDWRANTGKPKNLKNPKQLWKLACEYFQSIDENPHKEPDFIKGGESAGTIIELNKKRPYQMVGLENFIAEKGVLARLDDYRFDKDKRYPEYADIVSRIEKIIYEQKYDGAAVGAFPTNLITKDLGITEKIEQSITMEQPLFPDDDTTI